MVDPDLRTTIRSSDTLACVDVLDALDDLDPVGRRALQLIYWHDLSQAETAAALKLPVAVVRSAVARGMRDLAARIAPGALVTGGRAVR